MVRAVDEAAQHIAAHFSKGAALDITEVTLNSEDFEYDIGALVSLDAVIKQVADGIEGAEVKEKFNPLFLPQRMEEVDEVLDLQLKNDGVRFTGMDGNPFTIKMVDMRRDEEPLLLGKAQYHPFELPSYTEIVDTHERIHIN